MPDTLADLLQEILAFRDERDWAQFHTPRNLAAALAIEAAELQETMLWKTDEEIAVMLANPTASLKVRQEVADVLTYALLLCQAANIDAADAVRDKLAQNRTKYPVHLARGKATKYTDL